MSLGQLIWNEHYLSQLLEPGSLEFILIYCEYKCTQKMYLSEKDYRKIA